MIVVNTASLICMARPQSMTHTGKSRGEWNETSFPMKHHTYAISDFQPMIPAQFVQYEGGMICLQWQRVMCVMRLDFYIHVPLALAMSVCIKKREPQYGYPLHRGHALVWESPFRWTVRGSIPRRCAFHCYYLK